MGFMTAAAGLLKSKLKKATATPGNVLAGETFYAGNDEIKTGTIQTKAAETKSITPTASDQSYTFMTNGKYCSGNMVVNVGAANNFYASSGNRDATGGQQEMRRDEGNHLAYANTWMRVNVSVQGRKVVVSATANFHVTNGGTSGIVGDGDYSQCWLNFEVPF